MTQLQKQCYKESTTRCQYSETKLTLKIPNQQPVFEHQNLQHYYAL